ncbi:MAG: cytochrome c-type biogenesis protein CcmH [Paracoccaceae bacterium]|jgi:cytochrome c-type biogenesis protein CcmH
MSRARALALALTLALTPLAGSAVQPDEVLADPALEARARDLSQGLRCLVCRNENIDDSDATLARDLRLLVRERLVAGDTNEEAQQYLVDRFGEYVLLQPPFTAGNMAIWLAGPALLLLGGAAALVTIRRSRPGAEARTTRASAPLTEAEQARLDALLSD